MTHKVFDFGRKKKCNIGRIICVACLFHLRWALMGDPKTSKKREGILVAVTLPPFWNPVSAPCEWVPQFMDAHWPLTPVLGQAVRTSRPCGPVRHHSPSVCVHLAQNTDAPRSRRASQGRQRMDLSSVDLVGGQSRSASRTRPTHWDKALADELERPHYPTRRPD